MKYILSVTIAVLAFFVNGNVTAQVSSTTPCRAGTLDLRALFDEIGREVLIQNVLPSISPFEVQVSDLPSGIYLGRLTSQSGVEEAKIIVRH
jgi:hypothetical protein